MNRRTIFRSAGAMLGAAFLPAVAAPSLDEVLAKMRIISSRWIAPGTVWVQPADLGDPIIVYINFHELRLP